ncbi:IS5 family transposase [Arhodomonas sp. SL1]|uniref:IS5 family transposase n=1 Tax=Arhodomonas sp. SL1 TaxID=3425691 RepID=UPI003F8840CA
MAGRGRPPRLGKQECDELVRIVEGDPTATLAELQHELERRTGTRAHEQTILKALNKAGFERSHDGSGVEVDKASQSSPARYGYQEAHREQAPEQAYASSVTDAEWALIHDLFESEGRRGTPPKYSRRLLLDACCYVVRTGCSWRMLPKEFPPWQNVYRTFRRWSGQGKFEQMHDRLRAQWREREQRTAEPSAAVIDAQSTRGSPQGGETGYDAGKKVKGRKRHLVVDTLGLLLAVSVTAANVQDRDGAHPVVASAMAKYPGIETLFADSGYAGHCAQTVSQRHDIQVQVVRHPANKQVGRWQSPEQTDLFTVQADSQGFVVLPKRWVVERTHAWVERARRLVMHHDRLPGVAEAWVWLTEARRLMRRLTV